jgi:GDPmannose 4,6-dehydratase
MDLSDGNSIEQLILKYKPDYFINTAAIAFVGDSWSLPFQYMNLNALGVLSQLEAIRKHSPRTRYFNMGTSEEFLCDGSKTLINEDTPIYPRNPYGCSKIASRHLIGMYRENYNLFAIQGWTFNFESELRGEKYVTRKITKGVARISKEIKDGKADVTPLELGNLDSFRSWQYAGEVARGIWLMINGRKPKEYILSTNESHSVREFVEKSFSYAGFTAVWIKGEKPTDEIYYDLDSGTVIVKVNPQFYRPLDVAYLQGDASRIKKDLGWEHTVRFDDLVKKMVERDLELTFGDKNVSLIHDY